MTQHHPINIATRPQAARGPRLMVMPLLLASLGACAPRAADSVAPDAAISEPDLTGAVQLAYLEELDGASELEYSVARDDTSRVQLVFGADPELAPGTELEVWGEWEGDSRLIVRDFEATSIPKRLDAPWIRKPLLHRVAVLTADAVSVTESDVAREMAEVNRFYTETTRGIDTFSMEVYRNYKLGLSSADCDDRSGVTNRLTDAFQQEGFDQANYEHLVIIVPKSCGSWGGASAFVGAVGDDGSYSVRKRSIFKDSVASAFAFIHELGHNLGMRHAQSAKCAGAFYTPSLEGCIIIEYGDSNDPMGPAELVHWNAPHRRFLGWIAPERVITAGGSGTFNLVPVDAKEGCGVQALRIPIPNEPAKYFYVEYRKARSDSAYAGTAASPRGDAVLITRSQDGLSTNSSTQRIELGTTAHQGALVGSRYDLGGGLSVQVRSMGAQSAQVVVQTPGTNPARDDKGGSVAALSDGSVGPTSCAVDNCPSDPNKTEPGQCGCGVADTDGDGDGTANCRDACPADAAKLAAAMCGCGVADTDSDGDGTANCRDACPADAAKVAAGMCGCGVADTDSDGDGTANCKDRCPNDAKKVDPGTCGCGTAEGSCGGSTVSQCVQATEQSTAQLACPTGQTISSITFASYGTPTGACGSFAVSSCNAPTSRSVVEAACVGKSSCAVAAQNAQFGDPCGGTRKQLAVAFQCGGLQPGLKRAHYTGSWSVLPNFTQLTPDAEAVASVVGVGSYAGTDGFGLVFTGKVQIGSAGTYDFALGSDDGSRLLIDGKEVIRNDGVHAFVTVTGTTALSQGSHDVRVEYFERTVGENLRLSYRLAGGTLIEVPAAMLFH